MHVDNNIDFLLAREDLLQVFTELVPQLIIITVKLKYFLILLKILIKIIL